MLLDCTCCLCFDAEMSATRWATADPGVVCVPGGESLGGGSLDEARVGNDLTVSGLPILLGVGYSTDCEPSLKRCTVLGEFVGVLAASSLGLLSHRLDVLGTNGS